MRIDVRWASLSIHAMTHDASYTHRKVSISPRTGSVTVSLVTHEYDATLKRTKTVYLGSFRRDLDPTLIPLGQSDEAAVVAPFIRGREGPTPFSWDVLARIREWLQQHGTYRQVQEARVAAERAEGAAREAEQDSLRTQIEAEVLRALGGCWRPSGTVASAESAEYALVQVAQALELAAAEIERGAAQMRAAGHRLTSVRSQATDVNSDGNPLDRLQAKTNRVRLEAFGLFISACQSAGLMERRKVTSS